MAKQVRARFYIEAMLGALSFIGFVATLINRSWIEAMFGIDPDQGSGLIEWGIVAGLVVATGVFLSLAGYEWRRVKAAAA